MLDSLGTEVFTIEMQMAGHLKADIMREPVAFKKIGHDPGKLTPNEALVSSLNSLRPRRYDYIGQVTDMPEEENHRRTERRDILQPCQWRSGEYKSKFLAGNVIAKCKGHHHLPARPPDCEKEWAETSVKALEQATPEAIPYEELSDINMGER